MGFSKKFYALEADSKGSRHDNTVFMESVLYRLFNNGWRPFDGSYLVGDSAYRVSFLFIKFFLDQYLKIVHLKALTLFLVFSTRVFNYLLFFVILSKYFLNGCKHALCKWICKLRSFLNREFTVSLRM